jgi:hypothetical protein
LERQQRSCDWSQVYWGTCASTTQNIVLQLDHSAASPAVKMAVAEFVQDLLSFEPAFGDDIALDKQLKQLRAHIEKTSPAVLDNVSLDVCLSTQ